MPSFTINIPSNKLAHTLTGFAKHTGWTETVEMPDGSTVPNPVSKQQNAKTAIRTLCRRMYVHGKRETAEDALASAITTAQSESEDITI